MLFKDIAFIDSKFEVHKHAYVGVIGNSISYISQSSPDDIHAFGEIYDGRNKLLLPGFVNAHSHAAATILRSYADRQPLHVWLNDWIFPFEAKMDGDDYYWSTMLGLAEMARYGITSTSDMYFYGQNRLRAIKQSRMKCNMSECIISFDDIHFTEHDYHPATLEYIRKYHNSENGRIKIDVNIHSEYTTQPTICKDITAVAKEYGLINTIHLSETKKEHDECKMRHNGMTPMEYFNSIGVLDVPVLIAHGVWLEENDREIMKAKGVSLATNPASNLKLGSGIADLPAIIDKGINLCVGSDGMASNNNHNILQDMYLMALLNRGVELDSTLMPIHEVFKAATLGGAKAQGRHDTGVISVGKKADLCVMDLSEPI